MVKKRKITVETPGILMYNNPVYIYFFAAEKIMKPLAAGTGIPSDSTARRRLQKTVRRIIV